MATKTATSSTKKTTTIAKVSSTNRPVALAKKVSESFKSTPVIGAFIAEFIGTFLFVLAFFQMQSSPLFITFAVVGIFLMLGGAAGVHLNPAVTIGAWVTRKINSVKAIGYIVAQALGGAAAWLVLTAFLNGSGAGTTGTSLFHAATITPGKEWYILFAELIGVTVIAFGFAVALKQKREKTAAAFTAGLAVLVGLYIAMSLTTVLLTESYTALSFLNPVFAFVANGLSWNIWPIAIYILVPVLGGIIGFGLQDILSSQTTDVCDCDCDCKK